MSTHQTALVIGRESFPLQPDPEHGWTMTTADVARAFRVTEADILALRMRYFGPFAPNVHIVFGDLPDRPHGVPLPIHWTRRGVILTGILLPGLRAYRVLGAIMDAQAPAQEPSPSDPQEAT